MEVLDLEKLSLINHEPDVDKNFLYAKDPYEEKSQLLINKRESVDLKYLNDSKAFIEYSTDKDDIYKNIEEYNSNKKQKILIVFGDMVADMLSNKKLNPIVTEFFISGRIKYFSCFYYTILFCCSEKYLAKFSTPFCYENSKQKRTSTNCI